MPDGIAEDSQLVRRLQSGELEALGELYERYRHQVYRTALAITHDLEAAEDILQETFLRMYRYAHRIDASLPLSPWLYRVTVNLSYTWAKGNKRWRIPLESLMERLVSPAKQAPEARAERAELREKVQGAIDSLPFMQRVVIVLYYLNGMSLKEIAETLDCPVGTVKSRLYHARENLRAQLESVPSLSDVVHGFT